MYILPDSPIICNIIVYMIFFKSSWFNSFTTRNDIYAKNWGFGEDPYKYFLPKISVKV